VNAEFTSSVGNFFRVVQINLKFEKVTSTDVTGATRLAVIHILLETIFLSRRGGKQEKVSISQGYETDG
jgi:hypothetical protein